MSSAELIRNKYMRCCSTDHPPGNPKIKSLKNAQATAVGYTIEHASSTQTFRQPICSQNQFDPTKHGSLTGISI